jgi:hypothetical protein
MLTIQDRAVRADSLECTCCDAEKKERKEQLIREQLYALFAECMDIVHDNESPLSDLWEHGLKIGIPTVYLQFPFRPLSKLDVPTDAQRAFLTKMHLSGVEGVPKNTRLASPSTIRACEDRRWIDVTKGNHIVITSWGVVALKRLKDTRRKLHEEIEKTCTTVEKGS